MRVRNMLVFFSQYQGGVPAPVIVIISQTGVVAGGSQGRPVRESPDWSAGLARESPDWLAACEGAVARGAADDARRADGARPGSAHLRRTIGPQADGPAPPGGAPGTKNPFAPSAKDCLMI